MRASDRSAIAVTISVMLACHRGTADLGCRLPRPELGVDHCDWRRQPGTATHPNDQRQCSASRSRSCCSIPWASASPPHRQPVTWARRGSSTTRALGGGHRAHAHPGFAHGSRQRGEADLRDGDRDDHDHDRSAGIRRGGPAWAIAPPATLFLVPALGLGADTGVISFCYIAVGYLAILIAEGLNATARWTRGLTRDLRRASERPCRCFKGCWLSRDSAILATIVAGSPCPRCPFPGIGFR